MDCNKFMILGLAAFAAAGTLQGQQQPDHMDVAAKQLMVEEMQNSVEEIALKYGNIPFGFLFTNDDAIGRLVRGNFAVLEETVEVATLLDETTAELADKERRLADVESQVKIHQEQLQALRNDIVQHQIALRERKAELGTLEARIAPMAEAVETLNDFFNNPLDSSIKILPMRRQTSSPKAPQPDSGVSAQLSAQDTMTDAVAPKQRIYGAQ